MLRVSEAIMQIFRDEHVGRNEYIAKPLLMNGRAKWDRGLLDQYREGFDELQEMGFIRDNNDGNTVTLLDPGYDYLYPPEEPPQTKRKIGFL